MPLSRELHHRLLSASFESDLQRWGQMYLLINQSAKPTVKINLLRIHYAQAMCLPKLLAFLPQTTSSFTIHQWISHLLNWVKMFLFLFWTFCFVLQLLYWSGSSWRKWKAQSWELKTTSNPTFNQYSAKTTLVMVFNPNFFTGKKE